MFCRHKDCRRLAIRYERNATLVSDTSRWRQQHLIKAERRNEGGSRFLWGERGDDRASRGLVRDLQSTANQPQVADDVDRGVAGGGHCSGTPALRRPSKIGSSWARYVGSSLIAGQGARTREMAKFGSSARPALTAECASSSRPSCARRGGQQKIWVRIISVGLDRPSKPRDRLLLIAELVLRQTRASHPNVSQRIARTEAQGLGNVSLGFFGAAYQNLSKSNS